MHNTENTIRVERMTPLQIVETSDYTAVWKVILESPKTGTPYYILGSQDWSVERLEKVRSAIRGRFRRCGLPFVLHLMRGPFLAFYWSPDREILGQVTDEDLKMYEALKKSIKPRRYRRTYKERLEIKKRRRPLQNLDRTTDDSGESVWEGW